ncbi:MAG: hypothetical protein U0930_17030 [Pirellulales bacterium]
MMTGRVLQFNLALLLFICRILSCNDNASAQNYQFEVPLMELQVYIQPDASAKLAYRVVFKNANGASSIDIVDIGLPNRNYNIKNMKASIDGFNLTDIRKSTVVNIGVETHLEGRAIASNRQGDFRFECTMPDMVYQDTTDKNLASFQVIPTWFDANSTIGRTKLQCAIHFPPGTKPEEVKYQVEKYKYTDLVLAGDGEEKHPVAIWMYDSWLLSSDNPKLAVSFPKAVMKRVVVIGPFGLLLKWLEEHPEVQFASLGGLGVLFGVIFFRFSHGTGFVLFFLISGAVALLTLVYPVLHFALWPGLFGLLFLNERALKRKRNGSTYLPAMATVEGGGIKRGLTAPQAAVLLEMPMGKVLSLVIFGLIKKGVLEKTADNPLQVNVADPYRQARRERLEEAGTKGLVIHDYEHAFINRLVSHIGPVARCDLSEPIGGLVKSVATRMSGFDLSDTQAYYRAIIQRAWKEAESIGEVSQRDQAVDRNFEWILMDEHWIDIFDAWARNGRPYRPWWERRSSDPVIVINQGGSNWGTGSGGSSSSTPETAKTSFSEVASSFAGWTENTMASMASAIEPMKMGLDIPSGGGILDLSGVDRVTGDIFKALAEAAASGNRGGGGGGGCACACAGCALRLVRLRHGGR